MLRHHGAVQVEVDGIEGLGPDRVQNLAGDAFIRVPRDMRRRAGPGPDHRDQFVPRGLGLRDEAADRHVHVAQVQDVGAAHERRKAFALHEALIGRLRRRKGIRFMLEACNQDFHFMLALFET
jgi:hypothetical protein